MNANTPRRDEKIVPAAQCHFFAFFRHSIPDFLAQLIAPPEEKAWITSFGNIIVQAFLASL
jgi:hypothetical protein